MFTKKQVGVLAAALASISFCGTAVAASPASSTMTVDTTLTTACEVSALSSIGFGASSHWQAPEQGREQRLHVPGRVLEQRNPTIYATGTRSMMNGTFALPFNLSLTSGAASDDCRRPRVRRRAYGRAGRRSARRLVYAKTYAADFKALPSAHYTADVTVSVAY